MIKDGLVSVTFRKLAPKEVVDLVGQAGLAGIEWGGDVHVPHGDLARTREVKAMTLGAGLEVAAYGSYYCAGHPDIVSFDATLASAVELGAPTIRVWAGKLGSADAAEEYRAAVVSDSRRIVQMAAGTGITVSFEFHRKTLTDTPESAVRLLREVAHPNIRSYWQPPLNDSVALNLAGLETVHPWLSNVHAYHYAGGNRMLLSEGSAAWAEYLPRIASTGGGIHYVMLEFVKEDSPQNFLLDAATLRRWIA